MEMPPISMKERAERELAFTVYPASRQSLAIKPVQTRLLCHVRTE